MTDVDVPLLFFSDQPIHSCLLATLYDVTDNTQMSNGVDAVDAHLLKGVGSLPTLIKTSEHFFKVINNAERRQKTCPVPLLVRFKFKSTPQNQFYYLPIIPLVTSKLSPNGEV